MSKGHKVGIPIEVRFRCNGDPTVVNPTLTVLDETTGVHEVLTIGAGLTALNGRVVRGSFTPDELGTWQATASDDLGLEIIRIYDVNNYSIISIGSEVSDIADAIGLIDAKVDLNQAEVLANLAALADLVGAGGGHFG